MSKSLKPGVVTGEDYKTLLQNAKEGGYALPAVNAVGTNSVNAVMEAVEGLIVALGTWTDIYVCITRIVSLCSENSRHLLENL